LLSKWPQKGRKETKEGREGKESNHNLFGEYTTKIIGVSGKLHYTTIFHYEKLR
jgi:hypothetical protein